RRLVPPVRILAAPRPKPRIPPGPIPRELPRYPTRTRGARQRPAQRGLFQVLAPVVAAEQPQVQAHDCQVLLLAERRERQPEPEALRERDLLLGRFARMQL